MKMKEQAFNQKFVTKLLTGGACGGCGGGITYTPDRLKTEDPTYPLTTPPEQIN